MEKKNSRDSITKKILEQKNESEISNSTIKTLEKNQKILDDKLSFEKKKFEKLPNNYITQDGWIFQP